MAARAGDTGLSKVRRYWRGRAPDWAWAGAAVAHDEDDARLASTLDEIKHVEEEVLRSPRRRRVPQAPETEIVSAAPAVDWHEPDPIEEEEEDDDAREERRARIRERALLLRQHEEEQLLLLHPQHQEEEDEEASESEETAAESDSDGEQMAVVYMAAPLFVPKSQRDTIRLKEEEQHRRRLEDELHRKRLEDRKAQTRRILLQEIIKEELLAATTASEAIDGVDTDDEVDQAEEHDREAARIKRSREESGIDENPVADRPKKMTIKKQMRFMQRYYHKGCFFQDDADGAAQTAAGACEIYRRDFSGPTGLDKMDVSVLPKVMQVKHFGRRGGRKWTHLVNEDTTYRNYS
uniref:Micro-fibrillar-associated protein 1 C-terminal domain-containing protein n=1 Tax=Oryza meridionalis TaxID=40149 RepID=A0A0E0CJE1_9ORYZ